MPRYDVECDNCGTYERVAAIADRHQPCETCGGHIEILITSSTPSKGFEPRFDVGLGAEVTGIGHRRQLMRQNQLDYRDHPSKGDQSARLDKAHQRLRPR